MGPQLEEKESGILTKADVASPDRSKDAFFAQFNFATDSPLKDRRRSLADKGKEKEKGKGKGKGKKEEEEEEEMKGSEEDDEKTVTYSSGDLFPINKLVLSSSFLFFILFILFFF